MKKITLLLCLLVASLGYSQVVLEDFDGTAPTFTATNGLGSTAIVADPTNASNMVGQLVSAAAGDPWQQADLIMQNNLIDLTTDTDVEVDIYSTSAINILSRVDDMIGTLGHATAEAQHNGTGWETLTFDFTGSPDGNGGNGSPNGEYSQISFFPSWVGSNAGNNGDNNNWNDPVDGITLLVDNITAVAGQSLPIETCTDGILNNMETAVDCGGPNCAACPTPPSVAAPTQPARVATDVLSFFCDDYSDFAVTTFDAGWCGSPSVTDVTIAGNPTKLYSGFGCQGIDFNTVSFDASEFTYFHIDFYTSDTDLTGKVFNIKLVDFGGGAAEVIANNIEININTGTAPAIVTGSWVTVDYLLPQSLVTSLGDLAQIVITSNLANVWYDNMYLHKNTTVALGTENFSANQFSVYPNPTRSSWTIKGTQAITDVQVFDILGKQVIALKDSNNTVSIDASNLQSGLFFAKVTTALGTKTIKLVKE